MYFFKYWTDFTHYSGVSIVGFEQLNTSYDIKILNQCAKCSLTTKKLASQVLGNKVNNKKTCRRLSPSDGIALMCLSLMLNTLIIYHIGEV